MNTSDQELIQQLLSNNPVERGKSWDHLYKICYPMVREMILKHNGSKEDAADVFQDGLVVFNHNLRNGTFRSESALHTYFFKICKNLWLKEYNRKSRQSMAEQEVIIETRQHFDFVIDVEIVTLLMNELSDDCRRILTEYYYNKRSMAELKEMFNVNSIQAAKNKKWRCRNYLNKIFKEKGVTPTWD